MERFKLLRFANADDLAVAAATAWLDEIAQAQRDDKAHCVALSGGRITLKLFAAVTARARTRHISFANIHFFWADERCVPPGDLESNFAAADQHFFQPLHLAPERIHRLRGEDAPELAAKQATQEMLGLASVNSEGLPMLDLILLGMGEDGHVASLFPREPESMLADRAIYRVIQNSPKPPPIRITLGYAPIVVARQVWVLASGAGKEAALRESMRAGGQTPLARVLRTRHRTQVYTDIPVD